MASVSLIIDIVLAVVCLIMVVKYTSKGFLKTVLDVARLVLSVVFAYVFRTPIAKMINGMFMEQKMYNWVSGSLTDKVNGISSTVDFVEIYDTAPEFYSQVLSLFGLNMNDLENGMADLTESSVDSLSKTISLPLANMISTVIAVVVVFIVSMIVLHFVVKLLNSITKIKAIGAINKLLGFALGLLLSAAVIWVTGFGLDFAVNAFGPMYPDVLNENLTKNSMIISGLKDMGLLDMFDKVVGSQVNNLPIQ